MVSLYILSCNEWRLEKAELFTEAKEKWKKLQTNEILYHDEEGNT